MRKTWRVPLLAGAALMAGLVSAGGTFALWNGSGTSAAGAITSGNLDIEILGESWTETSPDVDAAPQEIDPDTFLVRQGDTFLVSYEVRTELQGENMLGELSVGWDQAADLPAGVSGEYLLLDGDDAPLMTAPAPLGTATTIADALDTDDAGRTDTFTLQVELDTAGLDDRFGPGSTQVLTDLGQITVALDQVRTGEGFQ
ncbi:hypothetical protein LQF12_01390 [Ruania suaedae]|uniref:hypothetical protein n=1 Tax=Ruania suaedae TaxID=2897774 RepID=UPI001E2A85F4|nr:hypothetical protein [Ruania suaedae]UFU03295.1 hypothetical protein LQF12_01390 [Ruania suaedae]